ncbi:MAG: SRPBCC family protein [Planctomycetota bacterium]
MIRNIVAAVAGTIAGGIAVALVQALSNWLYPLPPGTDASDPQALGQWISQLPVPAFLIVLASWLAGCFTATFIARWLATSRVLLPSLVAWAFLIAATLLTLFSIPHPWWMWPAGVVACLAGGIFGLLLAAPSTYRVESTERIQADNQFVFQTISEIENYSQAVPAIQNVEFLTEQRVGQGTKFRETRTMNGREAKATLEVTEYSPPDSIRIISHEGGTTWDTLFEVVGDSQACTLTLCMDATPHHIFAKLLTPAILGMVRNGIEGDMQAVKEYCENSNQ